MLYTESKGLINKQTTLYNWVTYVYQSPNFQTKLDETVITTQN